MPIPTTAPSPVKAPVNKPAPAAPSAPAKVPATKPSTSPTDTAALSSEATSAKPTGGSGGNFGGLLAGLQSMGGGAEAAMATQQEASDRNQAEQTQPLSPEESAKSRWKDMQGKRKDLDARMTKAHESGNTEEWERLKVESRKLDEPMKSIVSGL